MIAGGTILNQPVSPNNGIATLRKKTLELLRFGEKTTLELLRYGKNTKIATLRKTLELLRYGKNTGIATPRNNTRLAMLREKKRDCSATEIETENVLMNSKLRKHANFECWECKDAKH